jgi:hypothetical protein
MWGKRPKRLSKRETLGLLADLMAKAEEEQGIDPEAELPYYQGAALPIPRPGRPSLRIVGVSVDNSTSPEPPSPRTAADNTAADGTAADDTAADDVELPAQRSGESSHHGSF